MSKRKLEENVHFSVVFDKVKRRLIIGVRTPPTIHGVQLVVQRQDRNHVLQCWNDTIRALRKILQQMPKDQPILLRRFGILLRTWFRDISRQQDSSSLFVVSKATLAAYLYLLRVGHVVFPSDKTLGRLTKTAWLHMINPSHRCPSAAMTHMFTQAVDVMLLSEQDHGQACADNMFGSLIVSDAAESM